MDDLALVLVEKSVKEEQYLRYGYIEVVDYWLIDHGLSRAAEKTEAVLIFRKRMYVDFSVCIKKVRAVDSIRYLEVTLDL